MVHAHHLHHAHARRAPILHDVQDVAPRNESPVVDDTIPSLVEREPVAVPSYVSPDNFGLPPGTDTTGSSNHNKYSSTSTASPSKTASSSSAGNTCGATPCAYNVNGNSTTTIPIVLGVIIPVIFFSVAMIVIWRIKKKRDRIEAKNDKHASLDFGLGEVSRKEKTIPRKGVPRRPEMMDLSAEKDFRKARGLSMDMSSPYVLPPELTTNRPSFHSMSRSGHDGDDPYAPVAMLRGISPSPTPGYSRPESRKDSASVWTASSEGASGMKGSLLSHAQPPSSTTTPEGGETAAFYSTVSPNLASVSSPLLGWPQSQQIGSGTENADSNNTRKTFARKEVGAGGQDSRTNQTVTTNVSPPEHTDFSLHGKGFDFNLPSLIEMPSPSIHITEPDPDQATPGQLPKRSASLHPNKDRQLPPPPISKRESLPAFGEDYETYADVLGIAQQPNDGEEGYNDGLGLGVHGYNMNTNRLSASMRPLPPDDPEENPESRANRIRSFYREYFDEKRATHMDDGYAGYDAYQDADYYEDYNQEYLNGATVVDAATGQFVVGGAPFSQPITRRAMTPPPRAPPRFRNGSAAGHRPYVPGEYGTPGSRARGYSSASAAGYRGRPAKRNQPPPAPLNNLPTPYLLKDDSAIFNAMDFAPPQSYKDRQAGRPESPMMDQRPYSPMVRPFTPLASSFDDLRAMPSPHLLRKSGTFTGLDFAPQKRFLGDTGSDAASIRSGRSGRSNISTTHLANIRSGAYRVSRMVPKGVVGTRDDITTTLRPTWDAGRGPT